MDEAYPETHFKSLTLFETFAPAVAENDLTKVSIVSSFEKLPQNVLKGTTLIPGIKDIL